MIPTVTGAPVGIRGVPLADLRAIEFRGTGRHRRADEVAPRDRPTASRAGPDEVVWSVGEEPG